WEGHQLPRTRNVRPGHLSIQRERRQRYQYGVLRRYDWHGLFERECNAWYWTPIEWCHSADDADLLFQSHRRGKSAEQLASTHQHVRTFWISNNPGEEPSEPRDGQLSVRHLVCRCEDRLYRGRRTGRGRGYVRRLAKMGLQRDVLNVGKEVCSAAG